MTQRTTILAVLAILATSQIGAQPRAAQPKAKVDSHPGVVSVEAMAHGVNTSVIVGKARAATQPALIASASSASEIRGRSMNKAARAAWRSSVGAPQAVEQSTDLDDAIRRLQAMELRLPARVAQSPKASPQPNAAGNKPPTVVAETPKAEPKSKVVKTTATKPATDAKAVATGLSDKEIERLAKLPDEQLGDIAELAATLKALGHNQAAYGFFQRALNKAADDDDKAWITLQMGLCKQASEPDKAQELFRQLLEKYKDSPWAKVAKAQDDLIEWYKTNKPRETIAMAASQPAR